MFKNSLFVKHKKGSVKWWKTFCVHSSLLEAWLVASASSFKGTPQAQLVVIEREKQLKAWQNCRLLSRLFAVVIATPSSKELYSYLRQKLPKGISFSHKGSDMFTWGIISRVKYESYSKELLIDFCSNRSFNLRIHNLWPKNSCTKLII